MTQPNQSFSTSSTHQTSSSTTTSNTSQPNQSTKQSNTTKRDRSSSTSNINQPGSSTTTSNTSQSNQSTRKSSTAKPDRSSSTANPNRLSSLTTTASTDPPGSSITTSSTSQLNQSTRKSNIDERDRPSSTENTNRLSSPTTTLNGSESYQSTSLSTITEFNRLSSILTTNEQNSTSSLTSNESNVNSSLSPKPNTTNLDSTSLLLSNTTKSMVTPTISSDSSSDDDDYDLAIDGDKISDEMIDDGEESGTNEPSDVDNLSANTSLTASSLLSSPSDELPSSLAKNGLDTNNNNINTSHLLTINEEEFVNESFNDPTILLSKVHVLLKSIRKFISMTHNISSLNRYFTEEIKLLIENFNRQPENKKNKQTKFKELTLDIRIRWSSTFVMISRFLFCSPIITSLTHDPYNKIKLKYEQYRRLKKLSFTSLDWSILKALKNALAPFNHSTKLLSTRSRPTLSITQSIMCALTNFLTVSDDATITLENLLKEQLLINFNYYLEKHVSDKHSRAALVSSKSYCIDG